MKKNYCSKTGVSVGVVLFVIIVMGLIIDSVIELNLNAHRRELEEYVWLDAKNAASAAIEYGFAQLTSRLSNNKILSYGNMSPVNSPLALPARFFTTYGNTSGAWKTSAIVLPSLATYNPADTTQWNNRPTDLVGGVIPNNAPTLINGNDPGNQYDPMKNEYITSKIINIYGKATAVNFQGHATTVYAQEQLEVRDSPLFANAIFYNMDMEMEPNPPMTVTGPVHTNFNAYLSSSTVLSFDGPFTATEGIFHGSQLGATGAVNFENTSGALVNMQQSGVWEDSTQSNFFQEASLLWGGNVQSSVFGVPTENPVAVPSYVPFTGSSPNDLNYAYQLIDPVLNANAPTYNAAIEQQKYSYQAGLTLVVTPDAGGYMSATPPSVTMVTYARNADGTIQYDGSGNPIPTTLSYSGPSPFVNAQGYAATVTTTGSGRSAVTTTAVNSGIYDLRQAAGYALVQIDMGKLSNALGSSANWSVTSGSGSANPSTWWNGIVYVQIPAGTPRTQTSNPQQPDGVAVPINNYAVQLINGTTIPNPAFTQANNIYGTTIATDAPLYSVGNYNSNGSGNINSNPPAAIAADSITVLSSNWNNQNSAASLVNRLASPLTEVNAAFLTGIVPTNYLGNGASSGGVENFPRFLENWAPSTFSYQGSLTALFQSEIQKAPYPGTGIVYLPPTRSWSFSSVLAGGTYPPGTPNSRSFRRLNYTEMTAAQWNAAMNNLKNDSNYW